MSDIEIETLENGEQPVLEVEEFSESMSPADGTLWYGAQALGTAFISLLAHILLSNYSQTLAYTFSMFAHQAIWWPVGIAWTVI